MDQRKGYLNNESSKISAWNNKSFFSNGEEYFFKKEGENITDYEVLDRIIDSKKSFREMIVAYV